MGTQSPNINLALVSSSEGATPFRDWVDMLTGETEDSNMMIIDREIGEQKTASSAHYGNKEIHVDSEEKGIWDNKADLIRGYYSEGTFYKDADKADAITPSATSIYMDQTDDKNLLYAYDTETGYFPLTTPEPDLDFGAWG